MTDHSMPALPEPQPRASMTTLHQLVDVLQNDQFGDLRKAEECFRIASAQWQAAIAEQPVVGRIHHGGEPPAPAVYAALNSVGRALPDGAAVYAHPPKEAEPAPQGVQIEDGAMADYTLSIVSDSGYEATTEGRCNAKQYGAAIGALCNALPTEASKPVAGIPASDCAGGSPCTDCPNKKLCQRGCFRQPEFISHEYHDRKDREALATQPPREEAMFLTITLENVNEGTQWVATSNHSRRIIVGQQSAHEALRLALIDAGAAPDNRLDVEQKSMSPDEQERLRKARHLLCNTPLISPSEVVAKLLTTKQAEAPTASNEREAPSDDDDPLTPEQEEWVMDLAEKHNLGRRMSGSTPRGLAPDVFYTDASYRTGELFSFAAELLAWKAGDGNV